MRSRLPWAPKFCAARDIPWLETQAAASFDGAPPEVELIVVAGSGMSSETAERLAAAVAGGTSLVGLAPDPALLSAFGVTAGEQLSDAWLTVRQLPQWEHGSLPLLCPDDISQPLRGGETVAELRDAEGGLLGAGIVEARLGEGKAWLYGYDLCQAVVTFRHGDGDLHERPLRDMGPLKGPRHLYSFFELSEKTTRDIPVADVHQDILRTLVAEALSSTPLPRLWYFPDAAPALWFIKGDGCGEQGAPVLVDIVESYDALLTFYRAPFSRYEGDLMKEWHARGHAVSIEVDLTSITQYAVQENGTQVRYGRTPEDLNENYLPALRANLQESWDVFRRETGLDVETICSHGCQWTGYPLLQIMLDFGWYTPTHFASHDPRMRRDKQLRPVHDRHRPLHAVLPTRRGHYRYVAHARPMGREPNHRTARGPAGRPHGGNARPGRGHGGSHLGGIRRGARPLCRECGHALARDADRELPPRLRRRTAGPRQSLAPRP